MNGFNLFQEYVESGIRKGNKMPMVNCITSLEMERDSMTSYR